MANRFPLIVDNSALQIKELPSGDNLDLTGNSITGVANITASGDVTVTGDISIGGTLTYQDVTNVDSLGIITAQTGIRIGTLGVGGTVGPALGGIVTYFGDGSNLSGVSTFSGVGIQSGGSLIGYGVTMLNFVGTGNTFALDGKTVDITIAGSSGGGGGGGLTTESNSVSGIVTFLDLTNAQDHKVTATGIVTVTCKGGTEGESHTVRIINSGISTVGFSTFFLFPSGSSPTLPTASGSISLISFTVNRVGSGGTQLLAGASVNFS